MYSTLSQSSEQAFLLVTDLPGMVRIFETQYQPQYSEGCVGSLFGNSFPIEGFAYCASTLASASLVCKRPTLLNNTCKVNTESSLQ